MPLHTVGSGVSIKLIPDIDECLNTSDVEVVHGSAIEDDCLKGREGQQCFTIEIALSGSRIIPWPVTRVGIRIYIRLASVLEDVVNKEISVVVCVGVIETL
jgi:hypothetical protein